MADENGKDLPDQPQRVTANLGGGIEWTSGVTADSQLNTEWTTVLGGLPDLDPKEAIDFYARVSNSLATTRVRGFYGAMDDGAMERADDAVLFLYRDDQQDPARPVLKLVMSRSDMVQFADALSGLVERFRP